MTRKTSFFQTSRMKRLEKRGDLGFKKSWDACKTRSLLMQRERLSYNRGIGRIPRIYGHCLD